MNIFGWRLTNKLPSEEIEGLHKLLKDEKARRKAQAEIAKETEKKLEKSLAEEQSRIKVQQDRNKAQALIHLRAAERYNESLQLTEGARYSELKAIVDNRLEKAEQLGHPLNGTITETIQWLLTH